MVFFVVAIIVSLFPRSMVTSPQKTGKLRVDIIVTSIDPVTQKPTPVEGFLIAGGEISCLPGSSKGIPWDKWCFQMSTNHPVQTDVNGNAMLWFTVSPPPQELGVQRNKGSGRFPRIWIPYMNGGGASYQPETLSADHWLIHARLPSWATEAAENISSISAPTEKE